MNRSSWRAMGFLLSAAGAALLLTPAAASAFSVEESGCLTPPKLPALPPLPKLAEGPKVHPESSGIPWTALFKFAGKGLVSVEWGCAEQHDGTAENIGYGISVEGRYGHGKAEEVVTLSVGKPTGTSMVQPWMGTHTFTTYLDCPAGDPWLLGKACVVTGTATPIPGIKFKGPFPLTFKQIPPADREQLLYKAFPPRVVLPAENAKLANGAPVTVQLAKSGPVAAQPVLLEFSSGVWAGAKTFTRVMPGSSIAIEGSAFTPGAWKLTARYQNDMTVGAGDARNFVIDAAWGGGPPGGGSASKPQPGSEPPSVPVQPVPPPKTRLPPETTRGR